MWIKDPVTKLKSVSLTMLVYAGAAVGLAGILEMLEKVESTSVFPELFYSSVALYFGRRLNIKGSAFTSEKAEEIKEKLE